MKRELESCGGHVFKIWGTVDHTSTQETFVVIKDPDCKIKRSTNVQMQPTMMRWAQTHRTASETSNRCWDSS